MPYVQINDLSGLPNIWLLKTSLVKSFPLLIRTHTPKNCLIFILSSLNLYIQRYICSISNKPASIYIVGEKNRRGPENHSQDIILLFSFSFFHKLEKRYKWSLTDSRYAYIPLFTKCSRFCYNGASKLIPCKTKFQEKEFMTKLRKAMLILDI